MNLEEEIKAGAETPRYRHLVEKYLVGSGVDIGTGGFSPVVPNAICIEQPQGDFARYTQNRIPNAPVHLWSGAMDLPFKDGSLDYVYCGHVLEDFNRDTLWRTIILEWLRCLRIGGKLVILVPEFILWNDAIKRGQPPNCSHWAPEPSVGDITKVTSALGVKTIKEELTNLWAGDYTIIYVGEKA